MYILNKSIRLQCSNDCNAVVISSNDDKRLQTFDKTTTYPYGANAFKLCESEMRIKTK